MSDAIVVHPSRVEDENVGVLMRRATDVAGVCRDIVTKTAQAIQGRKYVRVEGWQSIAVAYGCVASARDVEAVSGGIRAIGEVRRMSDGAVIATAEGFVGDDEKTWASRPMYARRAMAQTRAVSRACRSAFAFVVTLIDGNLSTTPAEEMEGLTVDASATPPPPAGLDKLKHQAQAAPRPTPRPVGPPEPPPHEDMQHMEGYDGGPPATHDRSLSFAFGKSKGVPLRQLDDNSVSWYRGCIKRDLSDPSKAQYHGRATMQLAHVEAELRLRGLPV